MIVYDASSKSIRSGPKLQIVEVICNQQA
jgi:hypothetical protein